MDERILNWKIPKNKKPERKVRDIPVQKGTFLYSKCKGTKFSAIKQEIYCFFNEKAENNGQTSKNRARLLSR